MDVYQLKHSFLNSSNSKSKINDFIIERISNIISEDTPIKLSSNPKIIFHAIPIPSFIEDGELQIEPRGKDYSMYSPMSSTYGYDKRINFDGLVTYKGSHSYLQVFRSGAIESVDASIINSTNGEKLIASAYLEDILIGGIQTHLNLIKSFNVEYPIAIFLNITGIAGYSFAGSRGWEVEKVISDRNHLKFKEIIIENGSDSIVKKIKPWFDRLWQAFNYEGCHNYRSETEWHGMGKIRI